MRTIRAFVALEPGGDRPYFRSQPPSFLKDGEKLYEFELELPDGEGHLVAGRIVGMLEPRWYYRVVTARWSSHTPEAGGDNGEHWELAMEHWASRGWELEDFERGELTLRTRSKAVADAFDSERRLFLAEARR